MRRETTLCVEQAWNRLSVAHHAEAGHGEPDKVGVVRDERHAVEHGGRGDPGVARFEATACAARLGRHARPRLAECGGEAEESEAGEERGEVAAQGGAPLALLRPRPQFRVRLEREREEYGASARS